MNSFFQILHDKLSGIRNSEEHIKRRWAIGISACIMCVVVLFWVGYMNFTIRSVADSSPVASAPLPELQSGPSALATLRAQTLAATKSIGTGLSDLLLRLSAPRKLEIRKN